MRLKKPLLYSLLLCFILVFLGGTKYAFLEQLYLYHPYQTVYQNEKKEEMYQTIRDRQGTFISYDKIPELFIRALLCIEDQRFFQHHGFDLARIFSSGIQNIMEGEIQQGASTITQQVARMLYLSNEQSFERKIDELFYALKLEKKFSKKDILTFYVNAIYFAHGVYGLQSAADYYFHKLPEELSIKEIALLLAILNAPNLYSPFIDEQKSFEKCQQILHRLYQQGVITVDHYMDEIAAPLQLYGTFSKSLPLSANYYFDMVQEEIETKKLVTEQEKKHGITITSYLDLPLQAKIQSMIEQLPFLEEEVAVVVMEPNTGKVRALIGGKDYKSSSYNRASKAKRQMGSTVKPFLYYLALKEGMSPLTQMQSEKTTFHIENIGDYPVKNASGVYANRPITMLEALAMSDNIYAMKTMLFLGSNRLIRFFEQFGYTVDIQSPTIGLGANSFTPLEITSMYNCLASDGKFYEPRFISSIALTDSIEIYHDIPLVKNRLREREVNILQYMLRAPFDSALKTYGTPSLYRYSVNGAYGAKTGSTESTNWCIGFSPTATIGVYVGNDQNTPLKNTALARQLFQNIALFLSSDADAYFTVRDDVTSIQLKNVATQKLSFPYLI